MGKSYRESADTFQKVCAASRKAAGRPCFPKGSKGRNSSLKAENWNDEMILPKSCFPKKPVFPFCCGIFLPCFFGNTAFLYAASYFSHCPPGSCLSFHFLLKPVPTLHQSERNVIHLCTSVTQQRNLEMRSAASRKKENPLVL